MRHRGLLATALSLFVMISIPALLFVLGYRNAGGVVSLLFSCLMLLDIVVLAIKLTPTLMDIFAVIFLTINTIVSFALNYAAIEGIVFSSDHSRTVSFFDALYFSVATWTTLGYGDFIPVGNARGLAMLEALVGYFVSALFIALVVEVLQRRRR